MADEPVNPNYHYKHSEVANNSELINAAREITYGNIARESGDLEKAIEHYRRARTFPVDREDISGLIMGSLSHEAAARLVGGEELTEDFIQDIINQHASAFIDDHRLMPIFPNQNPHDAYLHDIAEKLDEWEQTDLAVACYRFAMRFAASPLRAVSSFIHSCLVFYHDGQYDQTREGLTQLFDFNNIDGCRKVLACYYEAERSTSNALRQGDRIGFHEMVHLLNAMQAVFLTSPDTQQKRKYRAFLEAELADWSAHFEPSQARALVDGIRCMGPLYEHPQRLEQILQGLTSNRVFSLDGFIYKTGDDPRIKNESWVLTYFKLLSVGRIPLLRMWDTGKMGIHVDGHADFDVGSVGEIRLPSITMSLTGMGIAPHVQKILDTKQTVISYGYLPGPMLRDVLQDPLVDLARAYRNTIEQIARLHAIGPKHLLDTLEGNESPSKHRYLELMDDRVARGTGWNRDDWKHARPGYSVIAQGMSRGSIDSYVIDANPFNWVALNNDMDNITGVDFETVHICGPQYDLAKLLEHFIDIDREQNEVLIEQYIEVYNQTARAFNAQLPPIYHKQIITDEKEFLETYEFYVVDHVIKAIHNPNYAYDEFVRLKRDWMQRGADAIDWLQTRKEFSTPDSDELAHLKEVFTKYRDEMSSRLW